MKKKEIVAMVVFGTLQVSGLAAQSPVVDRDLEVLRGMARPLPAPGGALTAQAATTHRQQQIALAVATASKAREFYEKNPGHSAAAEAKRLEIDALARAVRDGAVEHEPKVIRLARDYRADKSNPSRDRFAVAVGVRELGIRRENHGMSRIEYLASYEKAAWDLMGEFPEEPGVFEMLLGIARTAEPVKAKQLAEKIISLPAPAATKEDARRIIDRANLPGKSPEIEWEDDNGASHRIRDYRGKIIVFYAAAGWAPSRDADLKAKTTLPPNTVLVAVNFDATKAQGQQARAASGVGGIPVSDSRGPNSPLARQLGITKVPGFYVVNRQGVFVGGGGPEKLDSLLDAAGK